MLGCKAIRVCNGLTFREVAIGVNFASEGIGLHRSAITRVSLK